MTDLASLAPLEPPPAALSRDLAFLAAGRHTTRVRLLRVAMLLLSVTGVAAVIVFAFFNPFRIAVPSVSIEGFGGLDGSKVTMDKPKLAGFRSDGRPYLVNAKTAVQDARQPNVLELHDIDGHVTMGDKSVVHIVSSLGTYDSSKETMQFAHDVQLTSDTGLDVRMKSAYVEFKTGAVDTREPLTVVMNTGTVSADAMHMIDNGAQATFIGHVHSVMLPASPATSSPTANPKAPSP